jgi:hypothetical protein
MDNAIERHGSFRSPGGADRSVAGTARASTSCGEIMRQVATGEVCADVSNQRNPTLWVLPISGFQPAFAHGDRDLPLLKAIKGAILAAKPLESGECRLKGKRS